MLFRRYSPHRATPSPPAPKADEPPVRKTPRDRTRLSALAQEAPAETTTAFTLALADSFGEPAPAPLSVRAAGISARELWDQL